MAGVTGTRSLGRTRDRGERRCPSVFPLEAATKALLSLSLTFMGMCDNDSEPPAMTMSACPTSMSWAASVMA